MIFIDTDVFIDSVNGIPTAVACLHDLEDRGETLAVTHINVAELFRGAHGSNRARDDLAMLQRILDRLVEVPLGPRGARRYGSIAATLDTAGRRIASPDGLVAAVVLENGGRIITRNRRDFERVAGLQVPSPQ